jgi:hypothetical protein
LLGAAIQSLIQLALFQFSIVLQRSTTGLIAKDALPTFAFKQKIWIPSTTSRLLKCETEGFN